MKFLLTEEYVADFLKKCPIFKGFGRVLKFSWPFVHRRVKPRQLFLTFFEGHLIFLQFYTFLECVSLCVIVQSDYYENQDCRVSCD